MPRRHAMRSSRRRWMRVSAGCRWRMRASVRRCRIQWARSSTQWVRTARRRRSTMRMIMARGAAYRRRRSCSLPCVTPSRSTRIIYARGSSGSSFAICSSSTRLGETRRRRRRAAIASDLSSFSVTRPDAPRRTRRRRRRAERAQVGSGHAERPPDAAGRRQEPRIVPRRYGRRCRRR